MQTQLADPRWKNAKTYFVQVEGEMDEAALSSLRRGVTLNDGPTLPADARRVTSRHGSGRAIRRFGFARRFRPAGWS